MKALSTLLMAMSTIVAIAQDAQIIAGPMLGYNTLREVAIWVQADAEAKVSIRYWPSTDRKAKKETKPQAVTYEKAHTATIAIGYLEPGTTYTYQLLLDGKSALKGQEYMFTTQKLWHWRESPPKFSFVAGSCMYVNEEKYDRRGKPYGQGNKIFEAIQKEESDFMLWLGDNIYLREADWNSRTGIYHRYSHMRQVPEIQELMHSMHHYAIWDDHDYGPNDSDWTYWNKDITREAFTDFWANPNYGIGGSDGITGTFWWNDCQFFMMDNRWYRTPQAADGEILGETQIKWLIDGLRSSKANFKFVAIGGQTVSDFVKYENHAVYAEERAYLLEQIDTYDVKNVIFLSGDRHSSELSKLTTADGDIIYDVTSSPLSSKSYDHNDEENTLRVGETIGQSNYAVIEIEGGYKSRTCTLIYKDIDGNELARHVLVQPAPEKQKK